MSGQLSDGAARARSPYYAPIYRPWGFLGLGCFAVLRIVPARSLLISVWARLAFGPRHGWHHGPWGMGGPRGFNGDQVPPFVEDLHRKMHEKMNQPPARTGVTGTRALRRLGNPSQGFSDGGIIPDDENDSGGGRRTEDRAAGPRLSGARGLCGDHGVRWTHGAPRGPIEQARSDRARSGPAAARRAGCHPLDPQRLRTCPSSCSRRDPKRATN